MAVPVFCLQFAAGLFKCKETEKIFSRRFSSKLPQDMQRVALRKLRILNGRKIL